MRRYMMRGRKAKACYWCSKGNNLETLSNKYWKKKNIRYRGETLIYNASFYIFKLIFIIFLALSKAYREFIEDINGENSQVLGILGTLD
jgi:hypothetical protein